MKLKILITGATGFVGSRLAARCVAQEIETHVVVRATSNLWRIKDFQKQLHLHELDLADAVQVHEIINKIKPDYVFHLACYGGFLQEDNYLTMLQTNIFATYSLLEACSQNKIQRFIYVGSSSEYGLQSDNMTENLREQPYNIYGISKLTGTHLTRWYAQEKSLPAVIFRIFSAYGMYEDAKRLIPSVMTACLEKQPLLLGSGKQVRDFIYVEDIVDAFLCCLHQAPGQGEIINLGSGKQHSVAEVVNMILEICNHPIKPQWNAFLDRKNEPVSWVANVAKAYKMLNWQPKTDLFSGLKATMNWAQQRIVA